MSRFDWLSEYLARLEDDHVLVRSGSAEQLAPAHLLELDTEDWGRAARVACTFGTRFVALWGDPGEREVRVYACLERERDYLVLSTEVSLGQPVLASLTPCYSGANRLERHLQDLAGIAFLDHPDSRRWTRHQAWAEGAFPLRTDFPAAGRSPKRSPADADYRFLRVEGSGVYEIPVGPVHAGIIEPGHFRFQAVGEEILSLEERLGYVHKGIEKIAVGRDPAGLARLAGRVSGDSTVAHTWAACMAMERATGCAVSPRAVHLRALMCERERVANHLGDIGAICNDVAFAFAHAHCARLREQWQRRSQALFGHRLMMDGVVPGGVACDLLSGAAELLHGDHAALDRAVVPLFDVIEDHPSLDDRLLGTGHLSAADARALGCTGYVGKASGQAFDVRRDNPYPPYDALEIRVPVQTEGDVAARVRVRMRGAARESRADGPPAGSPAHRRDRHAAAHATGRGGRRRLRGRLARRDPVVRALWRRGAYRPFLPAGSELAHLACAGAADPRQYRSGFSGLQQIGQRLLLGPGSVERRHVPYPQAGPAHRHRHRGAAGCRRRRAGAPGHRAASAHRQRFGRSLAIRQVDAGSCNGCELEIHALNNPYYDVERFGVHFVASPRHADALLVTGPVSRHMETALRRTWRATPSPKLVIAAGTCACTGGEFGVSYASCGAVENVIPVDMRIPGCPPTPLDLLKGLLGILREAAPGEGARFHRGDGRP